MKTIPNVIALTLILGLSLDAVVTAHAEPFAYVTNFGSNTVSVIDTDSNTVVDTVACHTPDAINGS
jgi:YVTN family beta-propeller protein